jgi:enamine deaminase RidA (YjgF/YER057c/UK114 family)
MLFVAPGARAQPGPAQGPFAYLGNSVRGVPVSPAVRAGRFVFVSGTPGFKEGKLDSDFSVQMKQAMDNVADTLKAAGAGWDRVVKVNVILVRREDFPEMNRIYATYFPAGKFPARTTMIAELPQPDFLLEIECEALLR